MSDCFDRGCNGCDDCIDPDPTEKVCIDPMCACRGGPCAERPNGEREAALTADEAPANAEEFHTMILNHEDALAEGGYEGMNHHWTRIALVNAFEAARTEAYAQGRKDEAEESADDARRAFFTAEQMAAELALLGEALMCATDHLDFDSLAISHCNALQTIQVGLAIHAGRTGDEPARRRANWTA